MQDGIYEIDLHGLSMNDCKMILDEVFEYLGENLHIIELRIVVGAGNNSEIGPVLPAYVGNYLKNKGYISTQVQGVIYVILKSRAIL